MRTVTEHVVHEPVHRLVRPLESNTPTELLDSRGQQEPAEHLVDEGRRNRLDLPEVENQRPSVG